MNTFTLFWSRTTTVIAKIFQVSFRVFFLSENLFIFSVRVSSFLFLFFNTIIIIVVTGVHREASEGIRRKTRGEISYSESPWSHSATRCHRWFGTITVCGRSLQHALTRLRVIMNYRGSSMCECVFRNSIQWNRWCACSILYL